MFFCQSSTNSTSYPFKIQSMRRFFSLQGIPPHCCLDESRCRLVFFRLTALIVGNSSTASTRINFVSPRRFSSWTSTDTMQLSVVVIRFISLAAFPITTSCSGRLSVMYMLRLFKLFFCYFRFLQVLCIAGLSSKHTSLQTVVGILFP